MCVCVLFTSSVGTHICSYVTRPLLTKERDHTRGSGGPGFNGGRLRRCVIGENHCVGIDTHTHVHVPRACVYVRQTPVSVLDGFSDENVALNDAVLFTTRATRASLSHCIFHDERCAPIGKWNKRARSMQCRWVMSHSSRWRPSDWWHCGHCALDSRTTIQ